MLYLIFQVRWSSWISLVIKNVYVCVLSVLFQKKASLVLPSSVLFSPISQFLWYCEMYVWIARLTSNHRIIQWLKLEETFRSHLVQLPQSSRVIQSRLSKSMSRWLLSISRDRGYVMSPGNLCKCLVTFTVKKCFLMLGGNPLVCAHRLILPLGTTGTCLALSSMLSPFRCFYTLMRSLHMRDTICIICFSCFLLACLARKTCLWQCHLLPLFPFFFWTGLIV